MDHISCYCIALCTLDCQIWRDWS